MHIVIFSATPFEVEASIQHINHSTFKHQYTHCITGVGLMAATFAVTNYIVSHKPNLAIMAGIAGGFNRQNELLKTMIVQQDIVADCGAWQNNSWHDVFDLDLHGKNQFPYTNGLLLNSFLSQYSWLQLPVANAITVNQITTQPSFISQFNQKYQAEIETMEGAALHYVCNQLNTPYVQIRTVSNYVGDRDKKDWKLKESIEVLNQQLITCINKFEQYL